MDSVRYKISYFLFIYLCYLTNCELNLNDGSPCVSKGITGTCVSVYRCPMAANTYIFLNAGIREASMPEFPEVCSYKEGIPIVCCLDCNITDTEVYKNIVTDFAGNLIKKVGPKAQDKCLDYFQYLPYRCRGSQYVRAVIMFNGRCYEIGLDGALGVGGRSAERWEFKHMALLGFGDTQQTAEWLCGGTVISEWFILTAAHCVYSTALRSRVTFAALGLLKRSDPLEYWKIYKIKRAIRHPDYRPPSVYHDIALLETEFEINFGRHLLPACLYTGPIDSYHNYVSSADASGWGELGHQNALADTLQVLTLDEFNATECTTQYTAERYMKTGYNHTIQMCYGSHERIVDTCRGDSGGPLQINIDGGKCQYTVIGVTSFGNANCGILGVPTIYTRVSHYIPWIESIVWPD